VLARVAGRACTHSGYSAIHINHLGLSGKADWALIDRIVDEEFSFVTNNRVDFLRLFARADLHAGLVVIVPNVPPKLQRALFQAALQYLAGRELINSVLEVTLEQNVVRVSEHTWPNR
jgi:hypothetical protein